MTSSPPSITVSSLGTNGEPTFETIRQIMVPYGKARSLNLLPTDRAFRGTFMEMSFSLRSLRVMSSTIGWSSNVPARFARMMSVRLTMLSTPAARNRFVSVLSLTIAMTVSTSKVNLASWQEARFTASSPVVAMNASQRFIPRWKV